MVIGEEAAGEEAAAAGKEAGGEEAGGEEEAAAAEEEAATQEAAAAGKDPSSSVDTGGEGSLSDRLRINLDAQIDAIVRCMEAVHLSRRPLIQKVCLT